MCMWSNETGEENGLTGSERYKKLRRVKDRLSFLIEKREYLRLKLGELKTDQKVLNGAANQYSIDFVHAFMAAAQYVLTEEQFADIEVKAAQVLMQKERLNDFIGN